MSSRPQVFDLTLSMLPVTIDEHVRWGDMDAFGHMNNTVFFRLFEAARMACFERLKFTEPSDNDGMGPILAHTECYFRRPLTYPQALRVGTRIQDIGTDRFTMDYGIFTDGDEPVLAACGTGLIVCYNYTQNARADIPDAVRKQIQDLGGDTID